MYAVIETGGKQYRVELGNEIEIERLDAAPGDTVQIDRVLLVADGDGAQIGRPMVDGALVSASVVRQIRGDKVVVFKYRPKARHRAKQGHRQELTVIRIADISVDGRSAAKEAAAESKELEQARSAAAEEAARQAAADRELAAKLAREAEAAAQAESKTDKGSRAAKAKAADSAKSAGRTEEKQAPAKASGTTSKAPAKASGTKSKAPAKAKAPARPKRTQTKKDE